jgi:hypothetical protein
MAQTLSPAMAAHVRASRYAQRERPAASLPTRISARRLAGEGAASQPREGMFPLPLFLALRGPLH